jgi:hypothetical protein
MACDRTVTRGSTAMVPAFVPIGLASRSTM